MTESSQSTDGLPGDLLDEPVRIRRRSYVGIKVETYDTLPHALYYVTREGSSTAELTYDRVTLAEAKEIAVAVLSIPNAPSDLSGPKTKP